MIAFADREYDATIIRELGVDPGELLVMAQTMLEWVQKDGRELDLARVMGMGICVGRRLAIEQAREARQAKTVTAELKNSKAWQQHGLAP